MVGYTPQFDRARRPRRVHRGASTASSANAGRPWRLEGRSGREGRCRRPEEWAEQVDHVMIRTGRRRPRRHRLTWTWWVVAVRCQPTRAIRRFSTVLKRITTPANVRKITGENWMQVLAKAAWVETGTMRRFLAWAAALVGPGGGFAGHRRRAVMGARIAASTASGALGGRPRASSPSTACRCMCATRGRATIRRQSC